MGRPCSRPGGAVCCGSACSAGASGSSQVHPPSLDGRAECARKPTGIHPRSPLRSSSGPKFERGELGPMRPTRSTLCLTWPFIESASWFSLGFCRTGSWIPRARLLRDRDVVPESHDRALHASELPGRDVRPSRQTARDRHRRPAVSAPPSGLRRPYRRRLVSQAGLLPEVAASGIPFTVTPEVDARRPRLPGSWPTARTSKSPNTCSDTGASPPSTSSSHPARRWRSGTGSPEHHTRTPQRRLETLTAAMKPSRRG